ncbi:MAG: flagellar protein FlgN [Spirochaetes bacterium]|nr:flagellar protein FlgN [Spirochaetota bacterium]
MECADKLVIILSEQGELYKELETIELKKTEVIIDRNGKELADLVLDQEKLAARVDRLEKSRIQVTEEISRHYNSDQPVYTITQVAALVGVRTGDLLLGYGKELRDTITRIKALSDTNKRCMKDNLDFFSLMIESLRETVRSDDGYSASGSSRKSSTQSALFNLTV